MGYIINTINLMQNSALKSSYCHSQQQIFLDTAANIPPVPTAPLTPEIKNKSSFGCTEHWRWMSGSISVETDSNNCQPGSTTSRRIIRGVVAQPLRAAGYTDEKTGKLILTINDPRQQLELHITNIRNTTQNSSEFRYGITPDSPLIGSGRWESLR